MRLKVFIWILPIFLFLLFSGCNRRENTEEELIVNYLKDKGLDSKAIKTEEGVYYYIQTAGNGEKPTIDSKVTVDYKGYLLDGKEFDSSYSLAEKPAFFLYQVIEGWQIGIPYFDKGSKGSLFIPSRYAYGKNPPAGIPKNAILIFDIELLDIQ